MHVTMSPRVLVSHPLDVAADLPASGRNGEREEKSDAIKKNQAEQERLIKLDKIVEAVSNMMHIMGIKDEAKTAYLKGPTPYLQGRLTQSLQDINYKQSMYDEKEP